ncbi:isochorismatase family protein [Streptomyces sp. NPDC001480]|uniref:isochorismatase family protein n=1 Tax=Streptomyces sp. NPDC001480 TaxID=3364577 RepID=UPI0036BAF738
MAETYGPHHTAVLLVDPYKDFLSEGGKVWPRLEPVALSVDLLNHLRSVVAAARENGVRVVFVPHRRWEPGDYETWEHPTPSQRKIQEFHHFARGSWVGEFHPDLRPQPDEVVAQEHTAGSPTERRTHPAPRQPGRSVGGPPVTAALPRCDHRGTGTHVALVGLLANTCIEATARYGPVLR